MGTPTQDLMRAGTVRHQDGRIARAPRVNGIGYGLAESRFTNGIDDLHDAVANASPQVQSNRRMARLKMPGAPNCASAISDTCTKSRTQVPSSVG